ncbi:MAG TPA: DUF3500 domain-containing protein [Opitutaceae bacterium]|nr:DUF3500 domain-containing protein [Opitutaceae bacterium]
MRPTPRLLFIAAGLLAAATLHGHEAANEMVAAANKFLGALDAAQKKQATYTLTDAERENWNFVPITRQGLPLKSMSEAQKSNALALLKTGLSQKNATRAETIMSLENILRELEKANPKQVRDPINYYVTVFGGPSATKSWGWRFEGHHLSFNFTIVDGKHVFFTPSFMGSNPAEVRDGPRKGLRVLAEEEDLGLALINSLDESQRKTAIFADKALTEIVTKNDKRVKPLEPAGIAVSQFKPAQREKLVALVKSYLARWRPELADEEFAKINAAGIDKITFAWAGGLDRSQQTYYRIQGPTFLIEFDNSQGNGNHIHTTVRDFKGDFGHDLLADHYAKEHSR